MNNIMKKIKQLCQNKRKLNAEKYINKLKDNLQSSGSPSKYIFVMELYKERWIWQL